MFNRKGLTPRKLLILINPLRNPSHPGRGKYFPGYGRAGLFLVTFYALPVQALDASHGIDEQAKLPYWEIRDNGMTLRLVQRLPMQSRGYFLARGFTSSQVEVVAQACIFQTVFKNTSNTTTPSPLSYDLSEWQVISAGQSRKMKLRADWEREWSAAGVGKAQRIAFEWSLYPTLQEYKPGDYNWGMSSFDLKPGVHFDLRVKWRQFDTEHEAVIQDIECAPDINPPPDEGS